MNKSIPYKRIPTNNIYPLNIIYLYHRYALVLFGDIVLFEEY